MPNGGVQTKAEVPGVSGSFVFHGSERSEERSEERSSVLVPDRFVFVHPHRTREMQDLKRRKVTHLSGSGEENEAPCR